MQFEKESGHFNGDGPGDDKDDRHAALMCGKKVRLRIPIIAAE